LSPATSAQAIGGPQIGDLVRNQHGSQLVVTDIRGGQQVLRPRYGNREYSVGDHVALSLVARRGTWGDLLNGGFQR